MWIPTTVSTWKRTYFNRLIRQVIESNHVPAGVASIIGANRPRIYFP